MRLLPLLSSFALLLLLLACGAHSNPASDGQLSAALPIESTPAGSGPGECLLTYQRRLDELLPKATLEKHLGQGLDKAKLDYRKSEKYPKYDSYAYSWPSERMKTMKIGGSNISYPESNRVGLLWMDQIDPKYHPDPLKHFQAFYRTSTEAEKKQVAELLDKRLKEKGHSTEDRKTGGTLVNTLGSDVAYESVSGPGDAAAWSVGDSRLVVQKGRTTFKVEALVSADKTTNLNLARKLAGEVLAGCR